MAKYSKTDVADSLARLRELLPPGSAVYTTVTHVARSGMSRRIRLFAHTPDGPVPITADVARVLGWSLRDGAHWEMVVHGCGMDMCFHAVYQLAYALHDWLTHDTPKADATRRGYSLTKRDL